MVTVQVLTFGFLSATLTPLRLDDFSRGNCIVQCHPSFAVGLAVSMPLVTPGLIPRVHPGVVTLLTSGEVSGCHRAPLFDVKVGNQFFLMTIPAYLAFDLALRHVGLISLRGK